VPAGRFERRWTGLYAPRGSEGLSEADISALNHNDYVDLLGDEAKESAVTLHQCLRFQLAEMMPIVPPKRRMVLEQS